MGGFEYWVFRAKCSKKVVIVYELRTNLWFAAKKFLQISQFSWSCRPLFNRCNCSVRPVTVDKKQSNPITMTTLRADTSDLIIFSFFVFWAGWNILSLLCTHGAQALEVNFLPFYDKTLVRACRHRQWHIHKAVCVTATRTCKVGMALLFGTVMGQLEMGSPFVHESLVNQSRFQ